MKHAFSICVLICLSVIISSPASAEVDIFLNLDGIEGESSDKDHEGEIDVLGWGWQMSQSGTTHTGGGGGSGTTQIGDISIIKYADKASPLLYLAVMSGQHITEAVLTIRRTGGENPTPYLTITMTNVLVTSARPGGSSADERLVEQVTLNFAQVRIEYYPQNPDGSVGAPVEIEWDVVANQQV